MEYRRDIEGLRALAVIPVVIFHVAQSYVPGGFVGVDIFFVISGYLISSHILRERDRGSFSIISFYERRIRRIAPAYLVLLAVVSAAAVATSFPVELEAYGLSLAAAIGSVTNVYFWATTNYFAVPAEELPLLHTWSLSTEEQFYLLFPLMIVSIRRWRSRWQLSLVVAILLASFAFSAVTATVAPTASFYLIFSRAWELLLGVLLAMNVRAPLVTRRWGTEIVAIAGLLMIVWSMAAYSPETKFPGFAAVAPCLGAAFVISAGETRVTQVSRVLSMPPLRFFGVISYSLYLWHWPVLTFQRMTGFLAFSDSRLASRAAVVVVSVILATLSWAVVERTTRDRTKVASKSLMLGVAIAVAVLFASGIGLFVSKGLPSRFSPQVRSLASYLDYDQNESFRVSRCFLAREDEFRAFDKTDCLPNTGARKTYLVVGDSHAAALSHGLREALEDSDVLQVSGVGCPPIFAMQRSASPSCPDLIDLAMIEIPKERKIDEVLLVARWNLGRMGVAPGWNAHWLNELGDTVSRLRARGLDVVIIGPMPEYQRELPRLLAQSILDRDPGEAQRYLSSDIPLLDRTMREFAKTNGFRYVSLVDALCHEGKCVQTASGGVPLLFDTDHLTAQGSVLLANLIKDQIVKP